MNRKRCYSCSKLEDESSTRYYARMKVSQDRFYCKKCIKVGVDVELCGMRKKLGPKIKIHKPVFVDLEKGRLMRMFRPAYLAQKEAMNE